MELTFYLVAPFLLRSAKTTLIALGLSILCRLVTINAGFGMTDPWTYRFFPSELALFLLGALSNRFGLPLWGKAFTPATLPKIQGLAVLLLLFLCITYAFIPLSIAVKGTILLLLCVVLLPLTFMFQRNSRWDKSVGELSYPIYIAHMLAVWVLQSYTSLTGGIKPGTLSQAIIVVIYSCAFAYGLHRLVSGPVEKIRTGIRSLGT